MDNYLYHYKALVLDIYDADTIRVEIDLGFGLKWKGSDGRGVQIRLFGLDAPEMKGEEKEFGIISRNRLRELILGKKITLKTIKDSSEKYGRYLGTIITSDGLDVNEWLINEGLAKKMKY
jgi:micrococcal nuclease